MTFKLASVINSHLCGIRNDMFHDVLKAEFATLGSLIKVPSGTRLPSYKKDTTGTGLVRILRM